MIAGIDIGGTSLKAGIVDSQGKLLTRLERPTPSPGAPEAVADAIAAMVAQLAASHPVTALGVGCAGNVDSETGLVTAGNFGWIRVPFLTMLKERLALPVRIVNDAQAALLAEWKSGACVGARHAVMVTYGTGIGGGVILDGRTSRGQGSCGAELGHIQIHAGGAPCTCGARGCYEAYASAGALLRRARETLPAGDFPSARAVMDAARAGDAAVEPVFEAFMQDVCAGLMGLIMVFSPQVVVLGGGLSQAGDFWLSSVARGMEGYPVYARGLIRPELRLARYGNEAGIIGGAAQFL